MKNNYQYLRRNLTLGVINGIFFNLALAFTSGSTVVPLFITGLTDSSIVVGVFSSLIWFGWYFPQFIFGAYIAGRPLVLGYYNKTSVIRIILFSLIIVLIFTIKDTNHFRLLLGFGILMTLYSFVSGMAGITFMEIVGKMIPVNKRGTLFGLRMFFGGLLAALAGPVVKKIIDSYEYPDNFGYAYLISLCSIIMGLFVVIFIKENPLQTNNSKIGIRNRLKIGLSLIKNDYNLRRLVIARILSHAFFLASPFYVVMANQNLNIPKALAATYLSFEMAGYLCLNFLWGWLSNNKSNKLVLKISITFAFVSPIIALFSLYHNPGYFIFGLVFFFNGAALSGTLLGFINYLLEIVNDENRPLAMGLVHTIIAPTVFLSGVGGLIIEVFNLKALFIITLCCLIVSYFYIRSLHEPER